MEKNDNVVRNVGNRVDEEGIAESGKELEEERKKCGNSGAEVPLRGKDLHEMRRKSGLGARRRRKNAGARKKEGDGAREVESL